jgi:hypothetical protein
MGLTNISGKLKRKIQGILITENTDRKTRQELENKGFYFMEKPVDSDELLKKAHECYSAK